MGDSRDDNIKEMWALYTSTPPSLLGKVPSTVQVERGHNPNRKTEQSRSKALQEEKGHGYPDNLTETGRSHSPFRSIPNGLASYPAHCPENPKRQHLPLPLCANNYNQQHTGLGIGEEVLRFVKENSLCECQDCRVTKLIKEHNLCD